MLEILIVIVSCGQSLMELFELVLAWCIPKIRRKTYIRDARFFGMNTWEAVIFRTCLADMYAADCRLLTLKKITPCRVYRASRYLRESLELKNMLLEFLRAVHVSSFSQR